MSITIEQSDNAIRETFHSMEEGVDYVLSDFWFAEMNRLRNQYGYSTLKDKKDYLLSRKGEKVLVNGQEVFDFKDKTNLALTFGWFALALAAFAAFAFAFALQNNGIEKLNKVTCEGKVVEIDGRKYKLTAV